MQSKHITLTPFFGMCPSATSKAATSSSSVIESAVPKQKPAAADSTKAIPLEDNAAVSIGTTMLVVADTSAVARFKKGTVGKVTSVAAASSAAVTAATDSKNDMPPENNAAFALTLVLNATADCYML